MGLPTKLLADGETPLVVLRPHVHRLARPAVLLLLLSPAAAFAAGAVPAGTTQPTIRVVVAAVAAVVFLRWVVWPFVLWWNTLYVLTDERIFERAGVVRRTGHDLPLRGVTDVVVAQGLAERLLRCGTLSVTTEGGTRFTLTDVPAVSRLQRTLLAVADDVTERFAARPPRRQRRADGDHFADGDALGDGDHFADGEHLADGGHLGDGDHVADDGPEHDDPDDRSRRRELRRRERESARRLRALQDEVRRTPSRPRPDSPLEDDGTAAGPAGPAGPDTEEPADLQAPQAPGDDPGPGARILRFPRRP